jgi:hypothetical protein
MTSQNSSQQNIIFFHHDAKLSETTFRSQQLKAEHKENRKMSTKPYEEGMTLAMISESALIFGLIRRVGDFELLKRLHNLLSFWYR